MAGMNQGRSAREMTLMMLIWLCGCSGCIQFGRPPEWARSTIDNPDQIEAWLVSPDSRGQESLDALHGYSRLAGPAVVPQANAIGLRGIFDKTGNKFWINCYFFPDLALRYHRGSEVVDVLISVERCNSVAFGGADNARLGMEEARAAVFTEEQLQVLKGLRQWMLEPEASR
jgi:hypothetical protein